METEDKKRYLSASEFANISGVSRQTLIYYDNEGVFSPSFKDDSGYRYYDHGQIDLIVTIQALKTIGLSLKEIKHFIKNRDGIKTYELFSRQIEKLIISKNTLDRTIMMMKSKCEVIQKALCINTNMVYVEYHCATYIAKSNAIPFYATLNEQYEVLGEHMKYRKENNYHCGREVGGIVQWKDIVQANHKYTHYCYFYTILDNMSDVIEYDMKPAGNYLVVYFTGPYTKTYEVYYLFEEYAKQYDLVLSDYSYEESLIDEVSEANPNNYISQISIAFTKKKKNC